MADKLHVAATGPDPAQARELSLLLELEACWENLRKTPERPQGAASNTQDLAAIQKAYDAFRRNLTAYNRRYAPAHASERLLNTPPRLAAWCRAMQQVYVRVRDDHQAQCPVQLLEKTYRWADRVSLRLAVAAKFPGFLRNNIWDCMRRALSDWFPRGPSPGTPHTILLD